LLAGPDRLVERTRSERGVPLSFYGACVTCAAVVCVVGVVIFHATTIAPRACPRRHTWRPGTNPTHPATTLCPASTISKQIDNPVRPQSRAERHPAFFLFVPLLSFPLAYFSSPTLSSFSFPPPRVGPPRGRLGASDLDKSRCPSTTAPKLRICPGDSTVTGRYILYGDGSFFHWSYGWLAQLCAQDAHRSSTATSSHAPRVPNREPTPAQGTVFRFRRAMFRHVCTHPRRARDTSPTRN